MALVLENRFLVDFRKIENIFGLGNLKFFIHQFPISQVLKYDPKKKKKYLIYQAHNPKQSKKKILHYKLCPLTVSSSRKSWDIFALSIEKIDF